MPKSKMPIYRQQFRDILAQQDQLEQPEDIPLVEKILKKKGIKAPGLPKLPKL